MASIAWSDVTVSAPELSAYPLAGQADVLAFVNVELDVSLFDGEDSPRLKMARVYLAAHLATMASRGSGGAGPVTMEQAGGLMRQYANLTIRTSLESTGYGNLYLMILRTSRARWPVVL